MFEFNNASRCLSSRALNLVSDAVVAFDPQGHITYLNPAAEQLYGWRSEEVVGRVADTTLFTAGKEVFDVAWQSVREQGEWRGQIAQRSKNGSENVVEVRLSAVRERHSSSVTSILMIGTQISQLNMTAAGLAHEIRNPLASIKGVADAFLQRRQLTRQEREWMESVRYEVLKIDARMRELLDLAQPRTSHVKPCLLSELVNGVVMLAKHRAMTLKDHEDSQISIQFMDATTEPLVMPLDAARIEDAVLNLVLNAIDSIEGNGEVTVCLRSSRNAEDDDVALIEVTDTGRGIPLEIRRRIFEPLFTTKRDGTGLGLAAVRRTAAIYHGRITFKTRIGRGSKFVLALPLRSQPNPTENPE